MATDLHHPDVVLRDLQQQGHDTSGLGPVGVRPGLGDYLRQLWDRRHFIWMDARQRVASQNSRNLLGNVWLVLRPMMDAVFYFVLFGLVLQIDRGIDNFPAFIIIGVLLFAATSRALSQAPGTITAGRPMIRAFSFPRASIPIAAELRNAMQAFPAVLTILVMILVIPPHASIAWTWFLLPPLLILQYVLNLGMRMVLARVGFHFPDTAQMMSFVSRVVMYTSGVLIPVTRFTERFPGLTPFIEANPVYQLLSIARDLLKDGTLAPMTSWLILMAWAFGMLALGFLLFWRGEARYGADN